MGKGALIFVAAAVMLLGMEFGEMASGQFQTDEEQSRYEERVLAREMARSAFNIASARLKDDFESYRPGGEATPYRDGHYSVQASGPIGGPVEIWASGLVGEAIHHVTGTFERQGVSRFAALTLDGPVDEFDIRGKSYLVSGVDTDPPSGISLGGPGLGGAGLHSVLPETDVHARATFEDHLVIGSEGPGSFTSGRSLDEVDIPELIEAAERRSDAVWVTGPASWGPLDDIGTPENPAVVIVEGDLSIRGSFRGFGLLIVHGSLETDAGGDPVWEGLVVISAQGGTFRTRGNPEFWGAVVVQSVTDDGERGGESDAGLEGGHFDVSVFTESQTAARFHAHQYDDRFDQDRVDLLRLGCGTNGGLCWEEALLGPGHTEVDFEFSHPEGRGATYVIETTTAFYSGSIQDGLSYRLRPDEIVQFTIDIAGVCEIPGSQPDLVSADPDARDGTLAIRASSGESSAPLWETVIYHHVSQSTCTTGEDGSLVDVPDMDVVIEFAGNPRFQLSTAALGMLAGYFPELTPDIPRVVMANARETGGGTAMLP